MSYFQRVVAMYSGRVSEAVDLDDVFSTLSTLAKFNGGVWKSEKQGRFLQSVLQRPGMDRGGHAGASWAKSKGYDGTPIVLFKKLSYAKSDPSKVRYVATILVVDTGGVRMKGTAKVKHPTKDDPALMVDWSTVTPEFERTIEPVIRVDLDAEAAAQILANKPEIDLIKSIPKWDTKDILVSFVDQLSAGSQPLTLAQKAVLQKYLPQEKLALGDKSEWAGLYEKFNKVLVKLARAKAKRVVAHEVDLYAEYQKALQTKEYWGKRKPEDPAEVEKELDSEIDAFSHTGALPSNPWFWDELMQGFERKDGIKPPVEFMISVNALGELNKEMKKILAGKGKLTKLGVKTIEFLTRVVKKHG